jgi:hypothetical protein
MREGESEYGRDEGDRCCGAEDLPAWPHRTLNSGCWRSGNGRHRIPCRAQASSEWCMLCQLPPDGVGLSWGAAMVRRAGRSCSSQPRQCQGGNELPEIGLSPEPISRRPSCRCDASCPQRSRTRAGRGAQRTRPQHVDGLSKICPGTRACYSVTTVREWARQPSINSAPDLGSQDLEPGGLLSHYRCHCRADRGAEIFFMAGNPATENFLTASPRAL